MILELSSNRFSICEWWFTFKQSLLIYEQLKIFIYFISWTLETHLIIRFLQLADFTCCLRIYLGLRFQSWKYQRLFFDNGVILQYLLLLFALDFAFLHIIFLCNHNVRRFKLSKSIRSRLECLYLHCSCLISLGISIY